MAVTVPANAENASAIEWSCKDEDVDTNEDSEGKSDIIELSSEGLVKALNPGTTTVTATVRNKDKTSETYQDSIKIIVSENAPKLEGIQIESWEEGSDPHSCLYSGWPSIQKVTVEPVPFNAQIDPNNIKYEAIKARPLDKSDPEYYDGMYKNDEEKGYIEWYIPTLIQFDPCDGTKYHGKDMLINKEASVPAIVTIQATLYDKPVTVDESDVNDPLAQWTSPEQTVAPDAKELFSDTLDIFVANYKAPPANGVKSLSINYDTADLNLDGNDSLELALTANPETAEGGGSLQWTSSNPSVATVEPVYDTSAPEEPGTEALDAEEGGAPSKTTNKAVVTAKKPGTAVITGYWAGKQKSCVVTVQGEIELTDAKFKIGKTVQEKDGQGIDISRAMTVGDTYQLLLYPEPMDATNVSAVDWVSEDEAVVQVDKSTGMLTAVSAGSTSVSGTISQNGVEKKRTCTVTVTEKEIPLTGVAISESTQHMRVGDTALASLSLRPAAANTGLENASWSSSDSGVASVTSVRGDTDNDRELHANIRANAPGTCTITGTLGGHSITCTVIVEKEKLPLTLELYNRTTREKVEAPITMQGKDDKAWLDCQLGGIPMDAKDVYWSSNDSGVAVVDQTGTVTAVGAGTATISATATEHGSSAACQVSVAADEPVASPPTEPETEKRNIAEVALDGKYAGSMVLRREVTENQVKLIITPAAKEGGVQALEGLRMFLAEYDETGGQRKLLRTEVGTRQEAEDNIILAVPRPSGDLYKLMLWDSDLYPVMAEESRLP